jgi:toxin ParE1/3/4
MKVVMTPGARADLEDILSFLSSNYPGAIAAFERRLKLTLRRIERWPMSAAVVVDRSAIHMAPLVRYPYKIFYRVTHDVEILHIHHASRRPWSGQP